MVCNHKTNTPILKNRRKSLIARDSGGIRAALVRLWRLQACQRPSENCKRGRSCSSTIDASPQTSTAACVSVARHAVTWPLAEHLSTRIPNDPGDPIWNIWLHRWNAYAIPFSERWGNSRVFFPMRGALALAEHRAGMGILATPMQWLSCQRARGLQHRIHPAVCVIGASSHSCASVSSPQCPVKSICHGLLESRNS
jgi:hypothetical protein